MESEAFLIGHWKNFDELESNLSLDELIAIVDSSRKKDYEHKKFLAAIQGVDLENSKGESEDISVLKDPKLAQEEGLGINEGIAFLQMGDDADWQE